MKCLVKLTGSPVVGCVFHLLRSILVGLDSLVDDVFVSSGRFVRSITSQGVGKLERNIAAAQQALRNVLPQGPKIVLEKSRRYWALFEQGPQVSRKAQKTCVFVRVTEQFLCLCVSLFRP